MRDLVLAKFTTLQPEEIYDLRSTIYEVSGESRSLAIGRLLFEKYDLRGSEKS